MPAGLGELFLRVVSTPAMDEALRQVSAGRHDRGGGDAARRAGHRKVQSARRSPPCHDVLRQGLPGRPAVGDRQAPARRSSRWRRPGRSGAPCSTRGAGRVRTCSTSRGAATRPGAWTRPRGRSRPRRQKARERGVQATFLVHDILDLPSLGRTFETVIDAGLFHTLSDEDRPRYVRGLAAVLRPGGRYFMIAFSELEPPGYGPRRVTQAEIRAAFAGDWRVDSIRPAAFESRPSRAAPARRGGTP